MISKFIILGAGFGECILLQFSDKLWGMVDCCFSKDGYEKFKSVLSKENIKKFQFICLTHFHLDHFQGMWQIIQDFDIAEFWYPGLSKETVKTYHAYLLAKSKKKSPEAGVKYQELEKLFQNLKRVPTKRPVKGFNIMYTDGDTKICTLGPSEESISKFSPTSPKENLVSITLIVESAMNRIVLGGDTEQNEWSIIRNQHSEHIQCMPIIKISHHGSKNGMESSDWDLFLKCEKKQQHLGVLTPHYGCGLPDLNHISSLLKQRKNLEVLFTAAHPFQLEQHSFPKDASLEEISGFIENFSYVVRRDFQDSGWYIELDNEGNISKTPSGGAVKYPFSI